MAEFTDKDVLRIFNNIAIQEDGYQLFQILLDKFGAFERGVNFKDKEQDTYNRYKRELGLWLFDTLGKANSKVLMKIINERNVDYGNGN